MYYGERFKAEFGHRLNLTADELDKIDFTDTNYRQNHFRKGRNFKVPRSFYRKVQKEWKMLPETKRQQYEKRLQPRQVEQLVFPLAAPSIPAREKRSSNKLRREKKAK
jgi:hypothetical protein